MSQDKLQAQGNRDSLIKIFERSTRDLHRRIDMQHDVLLSILEEVKDRCPADLNSLLDCPHKRLLRQALTETIEVLEETKKAFKSKRLGVLRKKLMGVLKEET
jgi:hypothetical protein